MRIAKAAMFTVSISFLVALNGFCDQSGPISHKGKTCRAFGVKETGEFYNRKELTCFKTQKRAQKKGFISSFDAQQNKSLVLEATLSPSNTVPPSNSTATGSCTAVFNPATMILRSVCVHDQDDITKAHVHLGVAGVKGPMICAASSTTSPIAFNCQLNESQVDALLSGEMYYNLHSLSDAEGELRSQL